MSDFGHKEESESPIKWFFKIASYALLVFGCGLGGTVAGYVAKSTHVKEAIAQTIHQTPPQEVFGRNQLTLLVLGCDTVIDEHTKKVLESEARSDMMMVARLDFDKKTVRGVSIPRDIFYKIPGEKEGHRMNAFHRFGGPEYSKRAVESLLGVLIDRVVVIDYSAFEQLVDVVGGVTVSTDKPLKYDDHAAGLHIDIPQGTSHLDGNRAMGFVRYRHGDNDFQRQARQQQFVLALKKAVMTHPTAIENVASLGQQVLGAEFTVPQTVALALFGRSVPSTSIKMGQCAVIAKKGSTALTLNKKDTRKLLTEYGIISKLSPSQNGKTASRRRSNRTGG